MSVKLRRLYPHLWSNSVPNCYDTTKSYSYAISIIQSMHAIDPTFVKISRTRELVSILDNETVIPRVQSNDPSCDWDSIWKMAFLPILCNKLKVLNWRITHGAMCTAEKLHRWGIGDGLCSFCKNPETIRHMFWECPHISRVISWVDTFFKRVVGRNVLLTCDVFLRGIPNPGIHRLTWKRLVLIFSIVKKIVWNRRCRLVFDKRIIDEKEVVKLIKRDIQERIEIDFRRWSEIKFMKTWIHGSSFCEMVRGVVQIKLP